MAFETLFDASNATAFKFENKGDVLEGYYMGSFDFEGDYGPTKKHVFDTDKGAVLVFGQRNLIQTLPTVKPGTKVRITYTDDLAPKAKGRQPMKLFKFEQDRKDTREVNGVDLEPAAKDDDWTDGVDETTFEAVEEAPPAKATKPSTPARTPSAASQQETRNLLAGKRN